MQKYIKASDGSFVSFAKKAKTTFNPVTAACGGKKKVAAGSDKADKRKLEKLTIEEADKQSHDILDYDDGELKDLLKMGEREIGGKFLGFTVDDDHWFVFEDDGVPTAYEMYQGRWYPLDDIVIEGSSKRSVKGAKANGSKKVSGSRNISASYDEYDEDVNLPGKIRRQIAELTGWGEDDIAFAFQQWIYDGGGEYDPDEMPKLFRDDIASDVERGEDIEAKYLGD